MRDCSKHTTALFSRFPAFAYWRLAFLACLIFALQHSPAFAFEAPAFQGDVYDEAGLLSAQDKEVLLNRIRTLRESGGVWAAVYVAKSLQQSSIEEAAVLTFQKWALGQAGKDNGLLVLIVPSERKMRIEVGYGLEGNLTDAFSSRVINEIYKPAFREQRFVDGLMQGFEAMAQAVNGVPWTLKPHAAPTTNDTSPRSDIDWSVSYRYFLLTFALNLMPALLYFVALLYGRFKGRPETGTLWENVYNSVYFGALIGIIFGFLLAVFGAASAGAPAIVAIFAIGNLLFSSAIIVPVVIKSRRMLFESAYRRNLARQRLLRIRKRSKETRKIFGVMFDPKEVGVGQGGTRRDRSSSSSSSTSSRSSSSSSSGGRSGGGGASGSW